MPTTLFDGVSITFSGYSSKGMAKIDKINDATNDFLQTVWYTFDNDGKLKNGDTVTVTAKYNESVATKNKFIVSTTQKNFTVSGLNEYITSSSLLNSKILSEFDTKADDFANAYTVKNANSCFTRLMGESFMFLDSINDIQPVVCSQKYLLTIKNANSYKDFCDLYYFYDLSINGTPYGKEAQTKNGVLVVYVSCPALDAKKKLLLMSDSNKLIYKNIYPDIVK